HPRDAQGKLHLCGSFDREQNSLRHHISIFMMYQLASDGGGPSPATSCGSHNDRGQPCGCIGHIRSISTCPLRPSQRRCCNRRGGLVDTELQSLCQSEAHPGPDHSPNIAKTYGVLASFAIGSTCSAAPTEPAIGIFASLVSGGIMRPHAPSSDRPWTGRDHLRLRLAVDGPAGESQRPGAISAPRWNRAAT